MTRRDLATWRAAILAGVNAVFDVLDAAASAKPRTLTRPPAQPDGEYSELDAARARAIMDRHGLGHGVK